MLGHVLKLVVTRLGQRWLQTSSLWYSTGKTSTYRSFRQAFFLSLRTPLPNREYQRKPPGHSFQLSSLFERRIDRKKQLYRGRQCLSQSFSGSTEIKDVLFFSLFDSVSMNKKRVRVVGLWSVRALTSGLPCAVQFKTRALGGPFKICGAAPVFQRFMPCSEGRAAASDGSSLRTVWESPGLCLDFNGGTCRDWVFTYKLIYVGSTV